MKALFLGFNSNIDSESVDITYSTLVDSAPFGYDAIVVNALTSSLYGLPTYEGRKILETIVRWKEQLGQWAAPHVKVIVLEQPCTTDSITINRTVRPFTNYDIFKGLIEPTRFIDCGRNSFIGTITSPNRSISSFLIDNGDKFTVKAYYSKSDDEGIVIHSSVSDKLLTSFSVTSQNGLELIFIPTSTQESIVKLIKQVGRNDYRWKSEKMVEIESRIIKVEEKATELNGQKQKLFEQLIANGGSIEKLFETDIYLQRAARAYDSVQQSENPNPERYYEAIESVESAFDSEREMRTTLNVSKSFIDKVMRRANEFRHVAKDAVEPAPLTTEEKQEFSKRVETIIQSYIEYLLSKDIK